MPLIRARESGARFRWWGATRSWTLTRLGFPNIRQSRCASGAQGVVNGRERIFGQNVMIKAKSAMNHVHGGGGVGDNAPAIAVRQPEQSLFTRMQLSF